METNRDSPAPSRRRTSSADALDYCNIAQAAALLGVSRMTIWRWIRDGRLPAAKLGHRTTRIRRADIEHLLAANRPTHVVPPGGVRTQGGLEDADGRAPRHDSWSIGALEHVVQFYDSDDYLTTTIGDWVGEGIRAGETAVIVATPAHRAGIQERLRAIGVNVDAAQARGAYVAVDAAEILARVMADGVPDAQRFVDVVGGLLARASTRRPVRVFGEMVALRALDGDSAATIRLEQLWNELRKSLAFSLVCGYPIRRLGGEKLASMLVDVCAEHSTIVPAESYTGLADAVDRSRAIALLQQKASWLEAEIEKRKQAEEQLRLLIEAERASRQIAEEALRLRDEFIAVAAHELKTPLTPVLGQIQLAIRRLTRSHQADPDQITRTLREITMQGEKLARRIDQIIDDSQLKAGTLTVERRLVDLAPLVTRVAARARGWSDLHTITVDVPSSLTAVVDPFRCEQVLTYLLDNAIRFSPEGGQIDVILTRADPEVAELSVRDSGEGLPVEKRHGLFERFSSAHADEYRSGIGLGLYVSRRIVEMHGGEIRAEFPAAGGSRFVVRLPIGRDPVSNHVRARPTSGM